MGLAGTRRSGRPPLPAISSSAIGHSTSEAGFIPAERGGLLGTFAERSCPRAPSLTLGRQGGAPQRPLALVTPLTSICGPCPGLTTRAADRCYSPPRHGRREETRLRARRAQGAAHLDLRGGGPAAVPGPVLRRHGLRPQAGQRPEGEQDQERDGDPLLHREGAGADRPEQSARGRAGPRPRGPARGTSGGDRRRPAQAGGRRGSVCHAAPGNLFAPHDRAHAADGRPARDRGLAGGARGDRLLRGRGGGGLRPLAGPRRTDGSGSSSTASTRTTSSSANTSRTSSSARTPTRPSWCA